MANHGTLATVDGRPALRFERRLSHPIERVWRAISEPTELARWFVVAEVQWTPAEGEAVPEGVITAVAPPHRLEWTYQRQRFTFELAADGEGTLLTFIHVFDREAGPPWQHAAGWEAYFDRLDAHLDGGHLSEEDAHAGFAERQERYRASMAESPLGIDR